MKPEVTRLKKPPCIILATVRPLVREVRPDARELARIREVLGDAVELHGDVRT